jgi:hypothetical protein
MGEKGGTLMHDMTIKDPVRKRTIIKNRLYKIADRTWTAAAWAWTAIIIVFPVSVAVGEMYRYFRIVEKRYPKAEHITIALDNWPVHFHAFVLEELAKRHSRMELLPLPTYTPWTNPTEKVWGLLAKDVLNQHAFVEDWPGLQQAVTDWLAQYAHGSQALLHAVGLCPH